MEALVLLMKKRTVLPAPANRHGVEKSANGVNLNGSEIDGVSNNKRAYTNNLLLRRKSHCLVHCVYSSLSFSLSLSFSFPLHYILRERFRPKLIE